MKRSVQGFTLVELLVVITVIGLLVALIVPAVNMVREDGRQTTCMNNQKQLATAILSFDQGKQRLPGVIAQTPVGTKYTWVGALFPHIEHNDLWEKILQNRLEDVDFKTVRVRTTICPSDAISMDPTSSKLQALLSYGVNDAFFSNNTSIPPLDRNNAPVAHTVVSKLTTRPAPNYPRGVPVTTTSTVMLGERTKNDVNGTRAGKWTDVPPNVPNYWDTLAFRWPAPVNPPSSGNPWNPTMVSPNIMVSEHPGKVIVTFFDGHSEKLDAESTLPR